MNNDKLFLLKVNKVDNGCWLWMGRKNKQGYGLYTKYNKETATWKSYIASRYFWLLINGEIANGLIVCHSCNVLNCVNPDHLYLTTHSENNKKSFKEGKFCLCKGEQNKNSKLTEREVREIRKLYSSGKYSHRDLGEMYHVHRATIADIIKKRCWVFK